MECQLFTLFFKATSTIGVFDDYFPSGALLICIFRLQDGFHHTSYFASPNEFRCYYHRLQTIMDADKIVCSKPFFPFLLFIEHDV